MKTTKNYSYGCRVEDTGAIDSAILKAHQYRNKLCELERVKRDRYYEILRRLAPEYVEIEAAIEQEETALGEAREAIQRERASQRTKTPKGAVVTAAKDSAKKAKERLRELRRSLKSIKKASHERPAVAAALADNKRQHEADCRQAKQDSGLYWGTEAVVSKSCSSFAKDAPPNFARYDGTGQLGVQVQKGLDTAEIEQPNTLCYLDPDSRDGRKIDCYIRIGSDNRKPVFAIARVVLHRPLPEGAVKWAYLERRKMANQYRYKIRFSVEQHIDYPDLSASRWVAVHLGWTRHNNGRRVALWKGFDGECGSLVIPETHLDDYEDIYEVRSDRDRGFNEARDELRDWLAANKRRLPDWMTERTEHLSRWRSPRRLAGLVMYWRDHRLGDWDGDIFESLDRWRKRDKKRWQHESRLSARVVRRRNDWYRQFAAKLRGNYDVLYYSAIPKELTETSQPEDLERDSTDAHRVGRIAASSTLISFLREKFFLADIKVESQNLTRECTKCGHVNDVKRRTVQCQCRATWDVDENALANTIARGEVLRKSGGLLDIQQGHRDRESRQSEKLAKMQEANRAARKSQRKAVAANG